MNRLGQVTVDGKPIATEILDIQSAREPWCEYLLGDGSLVRFKHVAKRIHKVPNAAGGFIYMVDTAVVVDVEPPSIPPEETRS